MRISDWSSDVCPSDLFLIGFAFAALGLFDRTLDIVLRHPARARGDDRGAQPGIHRRIGQARLRRHRDLAAELGKQRRALFVLRTLAVHDVLEFGMAGHGRISLLVSRRSEEHTSELQSLMRISYAVFCL